MRNNYNLPIIQISKQRKRCQRNESISGFSLVEVIVVLMILIILAMTILPRTTDLIESMRLKAAGDKLKDDLRYIYDYAVARHDTTWLVVSITENSYGIYSGPSASDRELILDPATNRKAVYDFDDEFHDIQITAVDFNGNSEFYFDWWGTPSTGGYITINNTKIISVVPETGYVYERQLRPVQPDPIAP